MKLLALLLITFSSTASDGASITLTLPKDVTIRVPCPGLHTRQWVQSAVDAPTESQSYEMLYEAVQNHNKKYPTDYLSEDLFCKTLISRAKDCDYKMATYNAISPEYRVQIPPPVCLVNHITESEKQSVRMPASYLNYPRIYQPNSRTDAQPVTPVNAASHPSDPFQYYPKSEF